MEEVALPEEGWDDEVVHEVEFEGAGRVATDLNVEVYVEIRGVILSEAMVGANARLVDGQRAGRVFAKKLRVNEVGGAAAV